MEFDIDLCRNSNMFFLHPVDGLAHPLKLPHTSEVTEPLQELQ